MQGYRRGSHTVYDIEYYFVWVTKYRGHVLRGEVARRVRLSRVGGSPAT